MDRLDAIAIFVAVAEARNFAAAAKKLARSPAAVTRAVAALEASLGVRLLDRTTRSVRLTEVGGDYLLHARRLLEDFHQAEQVAAGAQARPRGTLRVAAPLVFGRLHVLPVVADYLARHPGTDVQLALSDSVINLLEEGMDVAVRIGTLPDSSLIARRVGQVRRVVCASRDYLATRGQPRRPADLAGHDAIVSSHTAGGDTWAFHRAGREISVTVNPRLVVNGAEPAMDAAAAGLGVARVLSYQLKPRMTEGNLVSILDAWDDRVRPVSIVAPAGRFMPAKVRAFIDLAARILPGRL